MDLQLTDTVVLVAGSSRGIGLATARAFLAEGARVMITGRDHTELERAANELKNAYDSEHIRMFCGDLTDIGVITSMLTELKKTWGDPEIVIANIGSGRMPHKETYTDEEWQNAFAINLHASIRLAQAVIPAMQKQKSGSIVFTSSIAGIRGAKSAPLPYATAKAAIISYAKGLANILGPDGIRVNCVAPGNIYVEGGSWEKRQQEHPDETKHMLQEDVPLQRFGTPEEIADLIVFLASPRSSFTTGACIVADGGQTRAL